MFLNRVAPYKNSRPGFAAGFAMGCERLISMLIDQNLAQPDRKCDIYFIMRGEKSVVIAQNMAETLRDEIPQLSMVVHAGGGSFKSQMRKADKSGARLALILGESEIESGNIGVKFLREDKPQMELQQSHLAAQLLNLL